MSLTSRKIARKALGQLLKSAIEGPAYLAKAVYAYPPRKWEGSPIVYVCSARSLRLRRGIGNTKAINTFVLEIVSGIAAANLTDVGYTPDITEDLLDDLDAAISRVVVTNPTNAAWANLQLSENEPSQIVRLSSDETGTLPYDVEIFTVEVTVYDT